MDLRIYRGDDVSSTAVTDRSQNSSMTGRIKDEINTLGQFIPLHYHYNMLQDEHRVNAFRSAIELVVRPGMHVLELGGGTGILSSFAARQGANVICVERNPELVDCAERLLKLNQLETSVTVVQANATEYIPSQPVDVVICEMLHVGLLREKQLPVIDAFKRNYIKRFGRKLPRFLPEASLLTFQAVDFAFDFTGYYAPIPLFQAPTLDSTKTVELSNLERYHTVVYDESFEERCEWVGSLRIIKSGKISALRFITQNLIALDTNTKSSIDWPNQFLILPLESPVVVRAGEEVGIEFSYLAGDSIDSLAGSIQVSVQKIPKMRMAA